MDMSTSLTSRSSPPQVPNNNQVNPPPRVPRRTFEAFIWSGLAICTLAIAFRCYVRIRVFRRLLADDFFTLFAWVLLFATAMLWNANMDGLYELAYVSAGLKVPSKDFVPRVERFTKGTVAVIFMFYLGLWTVKMNFLVLFYRLGAQITHYRVAWWIVTIFTVCVGLSTFGTIHYVCLASPFEYLVQHCRTPAAIRFQNVTMKLNCAWDVFTDGLIVLFPITILHNVRISLARKIALGAIFSLVVITMTVAIVRVAVVASDGKQQIELTWLYLWCFIESSVALLVACLASFRTLFAQQERVMEAKLAQERESAEQQSAGRAAALRARLRYMHASLFETTRDDGTKMSKLDSSTRPTISTNYYEDLGSRDGLPMLNTHNMLTKNSESGSVV